MNLLGRLGGGICLLFAWIVAFGQTYDATINPVSAITNSDGSELIADIVVNRSDGTQEFLEFHITPTGISTPGGTHIPPVEGFQISGAPSTGGSWGPGPYPGDGGGSPPTIVYGVGQTRDRPVSYFGKSGSSANTQGVGGVIVAGVACAAGWYISLRILRHECERNDRQVEEMNPGYCGLLGGSGVSCSEPITPPSDPPPDPDALFWLINSLSSPWTAPSWWDWTDEGPYVITDGL